MKIKWFLLSLMLVAFVSCNMKQDIASDIGLNCIVGKTIKTRLNLNLYEIDPQLSGYKDRNDLGGDITGFPIVGVIPPGHPVYIERVVRLFGPNLSADYLEGCLEYKNKRYSFNYYLGLSGKSREIYNSNINRHFIIPK